MIRRSIILVVASTALLGCGSDTGEFQSAVPVIRPVDGEHSEDLQISLELLFELGRDTDDQEGPILTTPVHAVVDAAGRILVYDGRSKFIHAYDSTGKHQSTVGGQGNGPAEFESAAYMIPLDDGRVLIYDYIQFRFAFLDPESGAIDVVQHDKRYQYGALQEAEDSLVALLYAPDGGVSASTPIFHFLDETTGQPVATFGRYDEMTSDFSVIARNLHEKGSLLVRGDDQIIFAPGPYGGQISIYRRSGDVWSFFGYTIGRQIDKSFEEIADPSQERGSIRLFRRGDVFAANRYTESVYLAALPDGSVLHFSNQFPEANGRPDPENPVPNVYVELFNSDLQLVSSGQLKLPYEGDESSDQPYFRPAWLDSDGRLYVLRYDPEPMVSVYKLTIN